MITRVVYGPPGTGKTSYLVRDLERRASKDTTAISDIAVVSFTKAAAEEMMRRLPGVNAFTIHSLCYKVCGIIKDQVVGVDSLKEFASVASTKFSFGSLDDSGGAIEQEGDVALGMYSLARNRMIRLVDMLSNVIVPIKYSFNRIVDIAKMYRKWKASFGFVDFTDMLLLALTAEAPRYKVLVVDEAQDLSVLQFAVLGHWMSSGYVQEVVLAGDDDQSIYVWSGADFAGMAKFAAKYGSEIVTLKQSHRIPIRVHDLAVKVTASMVERVPKEFSPKLDMGEVKTLGSPDQVPSVVEHGEDVLILYRCHTMRHEFEKALMFKGVPYDVLSGSPGALCDTHAKLVRLYGKLLAGMGNGLKPCDILSRAELVMLKRKARGVLLEAIFCGDPGPIKKVHWSNAIHMPKMNAVYLMDIERRYGLDVTPTIHLSTIHGAKGREADKVVLFNSTTEKIRRTIKYEPGGMDAEKRVFYVGVTRAKKSLYIVDGDGGINWMSNFVGW